MTMLRTIDIQSGLEVRDDAWQAPPSAPPAIADYTAAIVALLDAKAHERRYDGAVSLATYIGSTNPAWASEAAAFVAWRDAVWSYAYAELGKVQLGERPQPTIAEVLKELPEFNWPA
jgi:hypothetical protein